ncbi:MAG TPA: transposase [Chloroflexi bacterium]|jgi:transposase|nr:transposase [Chloroflexota bacterium]
MSVLLQPQLFPFDEFADLDDDNSRLALVLWMLPDTRLLRWLEDQRAGRRDAYPQAMLWRCIIAKFVYQIGTFAELIRELRRNGSLRRMVGVHSMGRVPKAYHFSRFLRRLSEAEGQRHLQEMFDALVARIRLVFPQLGRYLAVDGTAIRAWANQRGSKADPDARWGRREYRDGDGRVVETKRWLGYAVQLVVDCELELPVGFELTAANAHDGPQMRPLLEALSEAHPQITANTEAVTADRGYDSKANCRYVVEQMDAQAIIRMRRYVEGDEVCQAAVCRCNELGTPICASDQKMVYWGRDGSYLKWRCPVAAGKVRPEACQWQGSCSNSDYGSVLKQPIAEDYRRWPGIARESAKFERLYDKRGAVERVNARLKEYLLLDELTVRGMAKVRVHVSLALVVMLAGAAAMAEEGMLERVRQTVRLAA